MKTLIGKIYIKLTSDWSVLMTIAALTITSLVAFNVDDVEMMTRCFSTLHIKLRTFDIAFGFTFYF